MEKNNKQKVSEKEYLTRENGLSNGARFFIGVLISLILLAAIFLPYRHVTATEEVPYQALEEYMEQEPYLVNTTVTEEVPVRQTRCEIDYPDLRVEPINIEIINDSYAIVRCTMVNGADQKAELKYRIYGIDDNENIIDTSALRQIEVNPGSITESAVLQISSSYKCWVQPVVGADCDDILVMDEITKTKEKIMYRDVIKTRNVTRYRSDIITQNVNWIFGVKMPWHFYERTEGKAEYYIELD